MPTSKNVFTGGKMSLDVDERLIKKGEYRYASNINIANSSGGDVGAIEKTLSNNKITYLNLGSNVKTIGGVGDDSEQKLYWLVSSDSGSYIIEHDKKNNITSFVLKDTREENILGINPEFLVTGISLVIDTDNNKRFILYTDNNKQPRFINIERAKAYDENGFEEEEILLIKKPPLQSPIIKLGKTETQQENNIEEKFLIFSHRYVYLDGQRSALSPFSRVAYKPKSFNFDFSTSTNESMINEFNLVNISVDTGSKLVTDIEIVFKESKHNVLYLIESYNKLKKGWGDNKIVNVDFVNSKTYKTLSETQLYRLFDAVPLKAKALEVLNNLVIFGNYTENWNLTHKVNDVDVPINLNLELNVLSEEVTNESSYESNKSNRDYEASIVYGEGYGRHTTILTSEGNTAHVSSADCDKKNSLVLTVSSKPPEFSEWFRICIKQNRYDYDIIIPSLFYNEGNFVWIKIESADIDKISEGDFIYVKSDSQGISKTSIQTKVIEIEKKDKNFLETIETNDLIQEKGTYFKIKPNNFRVDASDLIVHESIINKNNGSWYYGERDKAVYASIYYGNGGLDDLISGGTYTGNIDVRYTIEIDSIGDGSTSFNKFKWREGNGALSAEGLVITPNTAYELENGVQVTFGSNIGHQIGDKWVVSAKTDDIWSDKGHAFGMFVSVEGETIEGNASISIIYDEYNDIKKVYEESFTSSRRYKNLEEWFYGDSIDEKFANAGIDSDKIIFRNGKINHYSNTYFEITRLDVSTDQSETTTMIIQSQGIDNNAVIDVDPDPKIKATIKISQSENVMIFETKSKSTDSDVFYEIGETYPVVNGYHTSGIAGDQSQTDTLNLEIKLATYNCFGWGNGFESIKIKDLFNADSYKFETRPNAAIDNYRENKKIASLTYSRPYSQSLNYNGLNEFNLSQNNSKDLDDKYGSIQIIKAFNTDLDVWQEDNVNRVLYGKTVLYNQDGSSNIAKSNLILDGVTSYSGEFGISKQPTSLAIYGNYAYWVDPKRGLVLRKGQSGIEIISSNGMTNWFRDFLKNNYNKPIFGEFDTHYKQYTITLEEDSVTETPEIQCSNEILKFNETEPYEYILKLNSLSGDVVLNYDLTEGSADISANFNGINHLVQNVSGIGNITFDRDSLTEDLVTILVTPLSSQISYSILNNCPIGNEIKVIHIVLNSSKDDSSTMVNRYRWGSSILYEENILFNSDLVKFTSFSGTEGVSRFPKDGSTIEIEAFKSSKNNGGFSTDHGDRLGYLVSETEYTEGDINTVLASASFPSITTINAGNIPQSDKVSFTFNRASSDSILYLIWDYSKFNEAPVANNDAVFLTQGNSIIINPLTNDTDNENDTLTPIIVTNPQHGTIKMNADGTITYTHNGTEDFSDSFTYKVTDGTSESNVATIGITISEVAITQDTKIIIEFDNSGSMETTLSPLQSMRDTILKDRLLPLYNNDSALYDANVIVRSFGPITTDPNSERTLSVLNLRGETPIGNVISLVFQDEASAIYHGSSISPRTTDYDTDLSAIRSRLDGFSPDYYRGVIFQVNGFPVFKEFVEAIQNGTGEYEGVNGLSDRTEFNYKYDITDGGTAQYYLDQIVAALTELGYEL